MNGPSAFAGSAGPGGPAPAMDGELEDILASAFAVPGGLSELNSITEPALGINILRDVVGEGASMIDVITKLRSRIEARGPAVIRRAIVAFYVELPGDEKLRDWVARHMPPEDVARVPEADFEAKRAAYVASRRQGLRDLAVQGFSQLSRSSDAGVASIVRQFAGKLDEALEYLQRVNCYKQLHDRLHGIQNKPFSRFGWMLLKVDLDAADLAEIATHLTELRGNIPPIRSILLQLTLMERPLDGGWVDNYERAIDQLGADPPLTRARLRQTTSILRSILSLQLATLNKALVEAARAIPFDHLVQLLNDSAMEMAGAERQTVGEAARALDDIGKRLDATILLHDDWQDLDTRLWGFELAYPAGIADAGQHEDVCNYWTNTILVLLRDLAARDPGDWTVGVEDSQRAFTDALGARPPLLADLGRSYIGFVTAIRLHFYKVDMMLLEQCSGLTPLLPRLRALARGAG